MLIDCKTIKTLLDFASVKTAQDLCKNGKLLTARRIGNAWCAEEQGVLDYLRARRAPSKGPRPGRGRNVISSQERRRIIAGMGKKTDLQIAREVGVSHVTVARIRKAAGVAKGRREPKYQWDVHDMELGTKPDREIAREIGCSQRAVWERRKKLGVPPCPRK